MTTTLGIQFACREGFDGQFSICTTDEQIVADEVFHRLTTDSVLGDTPEAAEWGDNVFRRCGSTMSDGEILALGPLYAGVLQRSPLIETADVTVTKQPSAPGTISLLFAIVVTPVNPVDETTGEPLSFFFLLSEDTFTRVGDPDATAST